MKLYNKPELNIEKFDIEDIITANEGSPVNSTPGSNDAVELSAGMEFDINTDGNEF